MSKCMISESTRATALRRRAGALCAAATLVSLLGAVSVLGCGSSDSPGSAGGAGMGGSAAGSAGASAGGSGAGTAGSGGSAAGTGGAASGSGGTSSGSAGSDGSGGSATAGAGGDTGTGGTGGGGAGGGTGGSAGAGGSGGTFAPDAGSGGSDAGLHDSGVDATGGGGSGGGKDGGVLKGAMVITPNGATAGDKVMLARMKAHGIDTTTFSDAAVTAALVAKMDVIVVSSSAESGPLADKITNVAVPILCIEDGQYRNFKMTGPSRGTDWDDDKVQTSLKITTPGPIVGSAMIGTLVISSVAGELGWGVPAATAVKGAVTVGNPSHAVIFGYNKGDQMVGMTAPAKRAGYAIRETMAANLNAEGTKLFDAALEWVLQ